jgi:hypothetical protein
VIDAAVSVVMSEAGRDDRHAVSGETAGVTARRYGVGKPTIVGYRWK